MKTGAQKVIGFALETDNEIANAADKLSRKHLDMIVLNSLRDPGSGFGTDTNRVTLLTPKAKPVTLPLASKADVAIKILNAIVSDL